MSITNATLLYQKLKADSEITTESIIKSLIEFYMKSEERQKKFDGINYYDSENTAIKERKEKDLIINHKIASGFYKKLVDQKVNYCCGNDIVVENLPEDDDLIDINDFTIDMATEASIKGVEWLYPYINAERELDYKVINSLECIPIWDTEFEDTLQTMIRFYKVDMVENGKTFTRNKVELYDKEKVTYYIEDADHNYIYDNSVNNEIYYNSNHYVTMGNVTEIKNFGWGQVPFIPLFNTKKAVYDLQNVKGDIDLYDIVKSDFANDLEFHQTAILVIINRGAQDLDDFREKLKKHKIIEIDNEEAEGGGAHYLTLEIPVEARKTFLEIIRKDIYEHGFGVDTKQVGDGNITNIVIKSRYADLDLKANKFIKQIKAFLKRWFKFVNIYRKIKGQAQIDVNNLDYVFDKKMIFNETEMIENFVNQGGRISNKTLLANHTQVNDVDKEEKQIEKEQAQYDERFGMNTENENDGDEDE